jgi:hypothetical protein
VSERGGAAASGLRSEATREGVALGAGAGVNGGTVSERGGAAASGLRSEATREGVALGAGAGVNGGTVSDVYGLSAGHASVKEAEHWVHEIVSGLGPIPGLIACTHLVVEPYRHVAVSVRVPDTLADLPAVSAAAELSAVAAELSAGAAELSVGAAAAAEEHRTGRAGRLVVYPGVDALVGVMTIGDLLTSSAIERVVVLGSARSIAAPGQEIDTRDWVRPQWIDGQVTLLAQPAIGDRLVPFEDPDPRPCCAEH